MITSGEGKHQLWLKRHDIEDHIVYIVGGGEQSHIGCVIVCEPGKETKMIIRGSHKDHMVLRPLAEYACKKYNTVITVIGGIHIDDATKADIDKIIHNAKELTICI